MEALGIWRQDFPKNLQVLCPEVIKHRMHQAGTIYYLWLAQEASGMRIPDEQRNILYLIRRFV
jgi:hypothetical protein